MKICIPIISFSKTGGIKVLTEFANRASLLGHEIQFVSPKTSSELYYPTTAHIIWIDSDGRVCDKVGNNKMNGFIKLWALFNFLKNNSNKYDVVVANHNLTCYPVLLGSKVECVYYIQAYEPEFSYEYENWIVRYISMFMAWITYFFPMIRIVNADIYRKYKNIRSQYVVPPGLDLEIFKPKKSFNRNKKFTVGCIGRVERWKGTQDVTAAVRILRNRGYDICYRVAFNKIDIDEYEYVDPIGHHGLADFYRSLDVLVAPAHLQLGAIHYPVIEGMACNVSVVTTGYYPADETNSYIVPVESPESIAEEIIKIIENPNEAEEKRLKAISQVTELSWDKVARKFFSTIESKIATT